MNRLFGEINDADMRRDLEKTVVEQLSKTNVTILTHAYTKDTSDEYILQLWTYQDDELYGGEIAVPDKELYDEVKVDFFSRQLEDTIRVMEEAIA